MISVFIHNSFVNEKKYILDFVFGEVFCVEYQLVIDNIKSYRFVDQLNKFEIADSFFSELKDGALYYNDKNLVPNSVEFVDYPEFGLNATPVLFGKGDLNVNDGNISLQNDLIAGMFFMLTRWEEIAISKHDVHGRFVESENLSIKYNFNKRPIVNEYLQLLMELLNKSGFSRLSIKRDYKIFLTHDVDDIARYDRFSKIIKALAGDLIKRKSINTFCRSIKDSYKIWFKSYPDVWNTFDFLMDISDKKDVKSRFYFIPGMLGENDVRFNINSNEVKLIIDNIKLRNHIIGIHPSYSTYCNQEQFILEKNRLAKYDVVLEEGRQHYLRFKNPQTWQDWDDCGFKTDSSIGFYENVGFRSGICFSFPVFNVKTRMQLNLRERPLIVMDTALRRCAKTKEDSIILALEIAEITKKYQGEFVLLWHNSNLSVNEWSGWDNVYNKIVESI